MANYGSPGDGDPDPWDGRRPDDGFDAGSAPRTGPGWGETSPGRPDQPAYHPSPGWPAAVEAAEAPAVPRSRPIGPDDYPNPDGADPYRPGGPGPVSYDGQPVPRRGKGPLIAVLAVLSVALLAAAGTLTWLLLSGGPEQVASESDATSGTPVAPASAAVSAVPTAPAPQSTADPRFVKEGQCVRNEGPAGGKPKLLISACDPSSYEVVRRFDGPTSGEKDAEAKCAKVPGYTNWFFFDSELDTLDFVLCLKQR
ncbi:hypothetical protein GA0074704_0515 [Micromonospora siamensis]|uniref:Flagellar basal body-associated protein FliL n=1 Tax=Micromonospora siamensis TaxID=299152 RepID=A0A1C5GUB8_9ACTN|nr:hypothetical protein GA0074704_0515 [Micromonospora siamensis]